MEINQLRSETNKNIKQIQCNNKQDHFSLHLTHPLEFTINIPVPTQQKIIPSEQKSSIISYLFKRKDKQQLQIASGPKPSPRISKLTQTTYSVFTNNVANIYRFRIRKDIKESKEQFEQVKELVFERPILFVKGQDKNSFRQILRYQISEPLLGGGWTIYQGDTEPTLILITTQNICKGIMHSPSSFKLIDIVPFRLSKNEDKLGVRILDVIFDTTRDLYYLLYTLKVSSSKKSQYDINYLYVCELNKQPNSLKFNMIDYEVSKITGTGVFDQSKVILLQKNVLLLSLFQQVVILEKWFNKFIAVDNIRVRDSNQILLVSSIEQGGQMVLIDKERIIYNDSQKIYAYYFKYEGNKLKLHLADNFKGIQFNKNILYDGILVTQESKTNIQILFFFNKFRINLPKVAYKDFHKSQEDDEKDKDSSKLKFSVVGIAQIQSLQKLKKMLKDDSKIPSNQIFDFIQRFNISHLQYYKVQWQASKKQINDIINHLLNIEDFQFVKQQLYTVLKKELHSFKSLIKIEQKLNKRLISNLKPINKQISDKQLIRTIRRILKSEMYLKKLKYQSQFQAFKMVDFIEIGKLKEVSLKEQIKLLSCKGFQQRLKKFLDIFKYLVITNFNQIFLFLIAQKSQQQLLNFLNSCRFLLPQQNLDSKEDNLWSSFYNSTDSPLTPDTLISSCIEKELQKLQPQYQQRIKKTIDIIIKSEWFQKCAFKKHCLLSITQQELKKRFQQLKNIEVYNLLFKQIFISIQTNESNLVTRIHQKRRIIQKFRQNQIIPLKYYYKVNVRVSLVEYFLNKNCKFDKTVSQLIMWKEQQIYNYIFKIKEQGLILKDIKNIYHSVARQNNFFEEGFRQFLESQFCHLTQINYFVKQIQKMGTPFQKSNQYLIKTLIKTIFKRVKINQLCNITFNSDLEHIHMNLQNLDMSQKFIKSLKFGAFFKSLQLDMYYQQLENNQSKECFIGKVIELYVEKKYKEQIIEINNEEINIVNPIQFLGLIFIMFSQLSFSDVIEYTMQIFIKKMISKKRFSQIKEIVNSPKIMDALIINQQPKTFINKLLIQQINKVYCDNKTLQQDHVVYLQNCINLLGDNLLKQKENALLKLILQMQKYQVDFGGQQIRKLCQLPSMPFLISLLRHFTKIQKQHKIDEYDSIYQFYRQYKNNSLIFEPQFELQFFQFQIERGYHLISIQKYQMVMKIIKKYVNEQRYMSVAGSALYEQIVIYLLCIIIQGKDFPQKQRYQLEQTKKKLIIHKELCDVNIKQLIVRLQKIFKSQSKFFAIEQQYPDFIENVDQIWFKDERKISEQMFRKDKRQYCVTLNKAFYSATYLLQKLNNNMYYYAFLKLFVSLPKMAMFICIKCDKFQIGEINKLIKQLAKKDIFEQGYLNKMFTLCLYVKGLSLMKDTFIPTFSFFNQRQNRLHQNLIKRDINILSARLKEYKPEKYMEIAEGSQELGKFRMQAKWKERSIVSQLLIEYYVKHMNQIGLQGKIQLIDLQNQKIENITLQKTREQKIKQSKAALMQAKKLTLLKKKEDIKRQSIKIDLEQEEVNQKKQQQKNIPNNQSIIQEIKMKYKDKDKSNQQMSQLEEKLKIILNRQQKAKTRNSVVNSIQLIKKQQNSMELTKSLHLNKFFQEKLKQKDQIKEQQDIKLSIVEMNEKKKKSIIFQQNTEIPKADKLRNSKMNLQSSERKFVSPNQLFSFNKFQKFQNQQTNINQQIKSILTLHQESQINKYLSKFQYVWQNQVLAKQVLKKVYRDLKDFKVWLKILKIIVLANCMFSKFLEVKALEIMQNAIKIEIKVDYRQIFSFNYFFDLSNLDKNLYYNFSFKYFKPNIKKILNQSNVHLISKMAYFCLGFNKEYQYKVQVYFVLILFQKFIKHKYQSQKEKFITIQKLRSFLMKIPVNLYCLKLLKLVNEYYYSKTGLKQLIEFTNLFKQELNPQLVRDQLGNRKQFQTFYKLLQKDVDQILGQEK